MKKSALILIFIFGLLVAPSWAADRCVSFIPDVRNAHLKYFGPAFPWKYGVGQLKQESACRAGVKAFDGGMGVAQFMPKTSQYIQSLMKESLNPYNPKDATRMQAFYMARIYKTENPHKKVWWSYQVYNGGASLLKKEATRAGKVDHQAMRAVCKRKVITLKSGALLDFCSVNYEYSERIFRYGKQYGSSVDTINFW